MDDDDLSARLCITDKQYLKVLTLKTTETGKKKKDLKQDPRNDLKLQLIIHCSPKPLQKWSQWKDACQEAVLNVGEQEERLRYEDQRDRYDGEMAPHHGQRVWGGQEEVQHWESGFFFYVYVILNSFDDFIIGPFGDYFGSTALEKCENELSVNLNKRQVWFVVTPHHKQSFPNDLKVLFVIIPKSFHHQGAAFYQQVCF